MNLIKWIFGLTFILLSSIIPLSLSHAGGLGEQAQEFSLPAISGETRSLKDYRGRVVLLNFWASWCAPCREELPALEKLYQQYRSAGFEIIGINIDKKRENATKYVNRFGLSFSVLLDPDAELIQKYPGRAMPISYLIDQKGFIQKVFFGFNREKLPEMATSIEMLLAQ